MIFLDLFVVTTMLIATALSVRQGVLSWRVATAVTTGRNSSRSASASTDVPSVSAVSVLTPAEPVLWPTTTVLIAAHNEEKVIAGCLEAMSRLAYPAGRLEIVVVNDRSTDRTREIVDQCAGNDPRIRAIHRAHDARPGKSSAIADAMRTVTSEVVVLFDADYLPEPWLLQELVAPFRDPTVGATMGRVVPYNADANLLTGLLDLERRAGYAVDQHGRSLLDLVPQFGGTVGGIRVSALNAVGGWREGHLTEDTDLTFRLALGGWRVEYLDHAACYEEVPEDWYSRFKQVRRWAYGHNDCMLTYLGPVLTSRRMTLLQKLDGLLILLFYAFPALALLSALALVALLAYGSETGLACIACGYLGPFLALAILAPYAQVAIAAARDRQLSALTVLPLLFVSSSVSMCATLAGFARLLKDRIGGGAMQWDKTLRFRAAQ